MKRIVLFIATMSALPGCGITEPSHPAEGTWVYDQTVEQPCIYGKCSRTDVLTFDIEADGSGLWDYDATYTGWRNSPRQGVPAPLFAEMPGPDGRFKAEGGQVEFNGYGDFLRCNFDILHKADVLIVDGRCQLSSDDWSNWYQGVTMRRLVEP